MANQEIDCEIVRDLLPLYHDCVVSDTTRETVSAHLKKCQPCREEYETLCSELPEESGTASTKERFMALMRKQKHKRFLLGVMSVVLAAVILIGGYFAQLEWMCIHIPADEIEIHKVFRYEMDDGYHFFLWYNVPSFERNRTRISVERRPEGDVLVIQEKRALITRKYGEDSRETIQCTYGYATQPQTMGKALEAERQTDGFDSATYRVYDSQAAAPYIVAVEVNGRTVWTDAEDGNTPVPDYVYAWDAFDRAAGKITMAFYDAEIGQIGVETTNGHRIIWDMDGNTILDTQAAAS